MDPDIYRDRYPTELSGGQAQRVGVARALGADPDVLLMDEPFGAIDPITRDRLQNEFLRLQSTLRKTIVFVTHDQWEAMTLATRIAVMHDGRLQQVGSPDDIYGRPANRFVAEFVGNPPINIVELNNGVPTGMTEIVGTHLNHLQTPSATCVGLRPEGIEIGQTEGTNDALIGRANVAAILPTGGSWIVELNVSGETLFATMNTAPEFQIGQDVDFHAAPSAVHVFDAEGNRFDCGHHRDLAQPQNQPIKV